MILSSQEFRNIYERFYNSFSKYLWPYKVLEDLANFEVEIFTAFNNIEKTRSLLEKLRKPVEEVVKEFDDAKLQKQFDEFFEVLDEIEPDKMYLTLEQVEEVEPDEDKQDKSKEDSESELEADTGENPIV